MMQKKYLMYFCNKNKIDVFFVLFFFITNPSFIKNLKPNFWLVFKYLMLIIAYPTQYDLFLQESYQTKNGLSLSYLAELRQTSKTFTRPCER